MLPVSLVWGPKELLLVFFLVLKNTGTFLKKAYPRFSKVDAFTRRRLNIKSIVRLATMRTAEAMKWFRET